jgi:hypothetical protein
LAIENKRSPVPLTSGTEAMFWALPLFSRKIVSEFETDPVAREQARAVIDFIFDEYRCYRPESPHKTPLYYYLLGQIEQADIPLSNNEPNGDSPVKIEEMTPEEKLLTTLSVARQTLSSFGRVDDEQRRTTLAFFSLLGQISKSEKIS